MAGMTADRGSETTPTWFGDVRGPLVAWFAVLALYTTVVILSGGPSGSPLPQELSLSVVLRLLASILIGYGPILLFLVIFVGWWERRSSLRDVFAGLGFRKEGFARSILWSVALFPLYAVIGLLMLMVASYIAPPSGGGQPPSWYPYYIVLYSFFPVAVIEEAFGRGYLLDRLMPAHPSGLANAMPAILVSSLLFTLTHLPAYLGLYSFSPTRTALLLAVNVFPLSVVLSVAYVRARVRNVAGPVFIHFLLDSLPYVIFVLL